MPPCRTLRSLNQDLNLQAAGKHTGTEVRIDGGGYAFAVVFAASATQPSADEVVADIPTQIDECAKELQDDANRQVKPISDLPDGAIGYKGEEGSVATEYAYVATDDDRLLVVGTEHPADNRSSVSMSSLLDVALKHAPDVTAG
ncbi:hypothetical protein FB381_1550 [Nocardioides albertanoniae]|uniref:Uncharacterized protein n=2 Tax=Nocardioides albertanoniae TaxID=1175486 RepID=A0A543A539_9ACTN|nr:hypothetical protein FB381_1550 [Nocardioides albertanoniae]